jgi:hypothetical protein
MPRNGLLRFARNDGKVPVHRHPDGGSLEHELENEQRQLIKRIGDFEADQNQRGDHQIKAEMHEGLETKYFRGLRRPCAKDANQIHCVSGHATVRRYCRM